MFGATIKPYEKNQGTYIMRLYDEIVYAGMDLYQDYWRFCYHNQSMQVYFIYLLFKFSNLFETVQNIDKNKKNNINASAPGLPIAVAI